MDETRQDPTIQVGGMDRREFLKKAGIATGAAAMFWMAPSIVSVGAPKAYAAITGVTTDYCANFGKPSCIDMTYRGTATGSNSQAAPQFQVVGTIPNNNDVWVRATDKKPNGGGQETELETLKKISVDDVFEICGQTGGNNLLGPSTYIEIYSAADANANTLLQTIFLHTSCSQPLIAGEHFGSMELTAITRV